MSPLTGWKSKGNHVKLIANCNKVLPTSWLLIFARHHRRPRVGSTKDSCGPLFGSDECFLKKTTLRRRFPYPIILSNISHLIICHKRSSDCAGVWKKILRHVNYLRGVKWPLIRLLRDKMALGENNTRYATLLCAFTVVVGYRKGIAMASLSLTKFCFCCPPNALYVNQPV